MNTREMRKAEVRIDGKRVGILSETDTGYEYVYATEYMGPAVSLTMPVRSEPYTFTVFPPFFDGLLPEGAQLEALLRIAKIDRSDFFGQLIEVGADVVGNTTIYETDE